MNATAKSLMLKGQDNLETAKKHIDDAAQHEVVGYNLAQATEFFLKALCSIMELEYPHDEDGHDLDQLMQVLEENNFAAISSHADVIDLTPYNSPKAHIRADERLNLKEYMGYVEDLKTLVGKEAF
jgi:HEPN domain-containing protein